MEALGHMGFNTLPPSSSRLAPHFCHMVVETYVGFCVSSCFPLMAHFFDTGMGGGGAVSKKQEMCFVGAYHACLASKEVSLISSRREKGNIFLVRFHWHSKNVAYDSLFFWGTRVFHFQHNGNGEKRLFHVPNKGANFRRTQFVIRRNFRIKNDISDSPMSWSCFEMLTMHIM